MRRCYLHVRADDPSSPAEVTFLGGVRHEGQGPVVGLERIGPSPQTFEEIRSGRVVEVVAVEAELFDDRQGRAVSVDSRAILEALRKVYAATNVVTELTRR